MGQPCILNSLGIRIDTLTAVSGQVSMWVGGHTTQKRDSLDGAGRGDLSAGTKLSIFELWGPTSREFRRDYLNFLLKEGPAALLRE